MQPSTSIFNECNITTLSDRAVLVNFGNKVDPALNNKVILLHQAIQQYPFEGLVESVPAYASLAIFYDVLKVKSTTPLPAIEFIKNHLFQVMSLPPASRKTIISLIKIPVCYDAEFGPDIDVLTGLHNISRDELISLHCSVIYKVYMIGFLPGFAYMGTLHEKLITPRKDQPRLLVPAGTVGIAGAQTGIYPLDAPGGWQLIGRTPLQMFNTSRPSPCLLSPGDQVQFVAITKKEFQQAYAHSNY